MKLEVITDIQADEQPLTYEDVINHLRLDSSMDEKQYVEDLIADAVAYAQSYMANSLAERILEVTFYEDDLDRLHCGRLYLPYGPVIGITSVTSNGVAISADNYDLRRYGNSDCLIIDTSVTAPVVIRYAAGYEDTKLPRDIRRALLMHIGTLYENREAIVPRNGYEILHGLSTVYNNHKRTTLVG